MHGPVPSLALKADQPAFSTMLKGNSVSNQSTFIIIPSNKNKGLNHDGLKVSG
jgi:hypothetical protein